MREVGVVRHCGQESDADPARDEVRVAAAECAYHQKRAYPRLGRREPARACRPRRARMHRVSSKILVRDS